MPKLDDLTGRRFGRLTVMERDKTHFGSGDHTYWICLCDCGKISNARPDALKSGTVVSCGCYHREVSSGIGSVINLKHGLSKTRLFKIWSGVKSRCNNPNSPAYKNYGGRGIYISKEWEHNFEAFYEWSIKNGYSDDLQIDRIDNNGPYSKENCRWVTSKENGRNKRSNKKVTINGISYCSISEASEKLGISYTSIHGRMKRYGNDISFRNIGGRMKWTIGHSG